MRKWLMGSILVLGPALVQAQGTAPEKRLYPEQMRSDLALLWNSLRQEHPDPFRYMDQQQLQRLVDTAQVHLATPMGTEAWLAELMPLLRAVGDAGTQVLPPSEFTEWYRLRSPLLPMRVAVIGDRLYLDEELKGFRSLPPGCELIAVNGMPAQDILQRLRAGLVPEGANTTRQDRILERDFPVLFRRFIGHYERFQVAYREADGRIGEQTLMAITGEQIGRFRSDMEHGNMPWRLVQDPAFRSAWLTLSTMDPAVLASVRITPGKFLENALEQLRRSDIRTLVLDLRGAGGGDPDLAAQVYSLVARKPFRAVSAISIGAGDAAPDALADLAQSMASMGGGWLPAANGRRMLRADDPRLIWHLPRRDAFQGKVYVLFDGATTEAAASLAMLIKRNGRGRSVGEEMGSNAASWCGGEELEKLLPATGCRLRMPMCRYVPEGPVNGPADRGEMPDHAVERRPEDVAKGRDSVRGTVELVIEALQ
jgi:hypothetical protein